MNARQCIALTFISTIGLSILTGTLAAADTSASPETADMPEMPTPQAEHQWLERFVGNWRSEAKVSMGPDQPSFECKGTQQARMLGGFWMIAEGQSDMMATPVQTVLTLGYKPEEGKYVGTWIDSTNHFMWQYVGEVSPDGKVLTLNTEGPSMLQPGQTAKYREVIDFKSDDHYTFTSSIKAEDGQWQTFMTANFYRVK